MSSPNTDPKSTRRELDERHKTKIAELKFNENEDLKNVPRDDLEKEVLRLRKVLNRFTEEHARSAEMLRDLLSHQATTKEESSYLHINKTVEKSAPAQSWATLLSNAGYRALGGGLPGAIAMFMQVTTLMWLRTAMNYQYRHGTSTTEALKKLYADGGVVRFYRGYFAAIVQGPLSRFGDTAANSGMLALLDSMDNTRTLPVSVKTLCASSVAALFRIFLMPVDCVKTIMQVEGSRGFPMLVEKVKKGGPPVLFHGAIGASTATFVGHYPWFYVHNLLNHKLPRKDTLWGKLLRNAFIGFCSSVVSDTVSNSLRVIKTTKQTSESSITYKQAVQLVVQKDGWAGLFGRGLKTRILANGIQGMLFTVIWKGLEDSYFKNGGAKASH